MSEEIGFSEESLRRIASQKVTFRYSVKLHAVIYIIINILLFILNFIFTPTKLWAFYPLFGWLIGLMIHTSAYIMYARGTSYGIRGLIFNLVAYIFGILLLATINLVEVGWLSWVLYPTVAWGMGLIGHALIYYIIFRKPKSKSKDGKSKKELAIEKEMEKLRKKIRKEE